jgi:hypothetical protein
MLRSVAQSIGPGEEGDPPCAGATPPGPSSPGAAVRARHPCRRCRVVPPPPRPPHPPMTNFVGSHRHCASLSLYEYKIIDTPRWIPEIGKSAHYERSSPRGGRERPGRQLSGYWDLMVHVRRSTRTRAPARAPHRSGQLAGARPFNPAAGDNLRNGAALNALQIAEILCSQIPRPVMGDNKNRSQQSNATTLAH